MIIFINIANDLSENSKTENLNCETQVDHNINHSDIKFIRGLSSVLIDNSFRFSQVSVLDTTKKLKSLKSNKACGYDKVSALISKNQLLK